MAILQIINLHAKVEDKEILNSLPEWNIEPPIEIKRGEE